MEGVHRALDRRVVRRFVPNRLEFELLSTAYEQIRPWIRKRIAVQFGQRQEQGESLSVSPQTARRASA